MFSPPKAAPARHAAMRAALLAFGLASAAPRAARAEGDAERAEALVLGSALNRFVEKKLPADFEIPGDSAAGSRSVSLTLVEARYCGGVDAGRGRLVGVVRLAGQEAPSSPTPPVLGGPRDCLDKIDELAQRRAAPLAGALAVVEIFATWAPWQLKLAIGNAATSGEKPESLAAALARAKVSGPLATLDTSAIRLATERGASLNLDLALAFAKGSDVVTGTFTPAGRATGRETRPPLLDPTGAPAASDAMAGATFAFANRVVALFSQDGPLVLDAEGQTIEIRGLQLSGAANLVTLKGRATSRNLAESARLAIDATGSDLKVSEIHVEPELEDCTAGGLGCRVRNTARAAAASAAAAALTSRYRGQLLRTFLVPPPFSFDIGGQPFKLRLTPSRFRATAAGPVANGKADLE